MRGEKYNVNRNDLKFNQVEDWSETKFNLIGILEENYKVNIRKPQVTQDQWNLKKQQNKVQKYICLQHMSTKKKSVGYCKKGIATNLRNAVQSLYKNYM